MSPEAEKISVRAPAKINLYLEVLGKRRNGYHDIRSIVMPVSLYDRLDMVKTSRSIETKLVGKGLVAGSDLWAAKQSDNLATRAAVAFQKATGHAGGVHIVLEKSIPIGGGMGGGSADAAAVLLGLNTLWGKHLPVSELAAIGAGVGSDVPALVFNGPVMMEGLGEVVTPMNVSRKTGWWVVLVNPGLNVSTADIYSRCKTALTSKEKSIDCVVSAIKDGDMELAAANLFNGLEVTVFRKYPLIEIIADELRKAGSVGVLLCGSGASVFALARNERQARAIAQRVRRSLSFPVWSKVARILPDGVMAAHGPLEA